MAPLLIALVALPACARIWGFADLRGSNDGSSAAIDGRAADLANITVPGVGGAAASRRGGTGGSGSTDNRDARSDGADVGADIRDASPADVVTVRDLGVTEAGFEAGPDQGVVDAPGDLPGSMGGRDAAVDLVVGPCAGKQCPAGCASASRLIQLNGATNNSGNFSTLGSVCIIHAGGVAGGWALANYDGRLVTVFGDSTIGPFNPTANGGTQPPIGPSSDGYLYWVVSPGTNLFVGLYYF